MRVFLIGLMIWSVAALAQATPGDSPSALVKTHSEQILQALDARRAEFRRSPETLQQFIRSELEELFDRDYSARLVLGRHSRSASPDQVQAFGVALTDNLLDRYGNALLDVDPGLTVRIRGETPLQDGRLVRVATEVERRSGAPVPVDYMFRQTDDGWRAFDVIVEGVSYVQTYRNQFDELLRHEKLDAVTARLADGTLSVRE